MVNKPELRVAVSYLRARTSQQLQLVEFRLSANIPLIIQSEVVTLRILLFTVALECATAFDACSSRLN